MARASAAEGAAGFWLAAALAIQNLGVVGGYVFNWRVFRPGRLGAAVAAAGAGLLTLRWIGHGTDPGWPDAESRAPWYFLGLATRAAAFVWGAAKAFAYWAQLRRRLALGLADAVVTNRAALGHELARDRARLRRVRGRHARGHRRERAAGPARPSRPAGSAPRRR